MQAYSIKGHYPKWAPNKTFTSVLKTYRKSSAMELLFRKFQVYRKSSIFSSVCFKNSRKSPWDNVCCGIPFYRCIQILYRTAALNSFLKSSQVYLRRNSTWIFYWEVPKNFAGFFFQNANERVLLKIQTSFCLEHQWMSLNGWIWKLQRTEWLYQSDIDTE